ncbi:MAG: DUF4038 domain-containing protein [Leadbetterella sp.]
MNRILFLFFLLCVSQASNAQLIHPWETIEINLQVENTYENPYAQVETWVVWKGPNFSKKVYGFWNGGKTFTYRLIATEQGNWTWESASNQTNENGLKQKSGSIKVIPWTKFQITQNPNRKGFIRSSKNGHGLSYADGSPFFMLGDTWLGATTWRLPFRSTPASKNYMPNIGIGFEEAVAYRKQQGFNSVSMIAAFPGWEADTKPSTYKDSSGVFVRNAWEKYGYLIDGKPTAKNMRDEVGNLPFAMSMSNPVIANFDFVNPEYFKSLDKKIAHLNEQGFVALLEPVRRDACPIWKKNHKFNESYARFIQYLYSRYGAYNLVFSGIHLDWIPKEYSLTANEFNEALTYHLHKYGPMPFGQPVTTLINNSTYTQFGHDKSCPWLTFHSVGNKPRDHRIGMMIDTLYNLKPAYPAINFEPYYTGWQADHNYPAGEKADVNSDRDNYFARTQMYGSVLSGALAGHVYGTSAYDVTTIGEPRGTNPHFWEALKYTSSKHMAHLGTFMSSEGSNFQNLQPAYFDISPQKSKKAKPNGLDGYAYMMRTEDKKLAMVYFENACEIPELLGFIPNVMYELTWYNPENGQWLDKNVLKSDTKGRISLSDFPNVKGKAFNDYALKIKFYTK